MHQINKRIQNEGIIRLIIVILGLLCFIFSTDFGWGFILGGVVSKEHINLKNKISWQLLIFTSALMLLAIYFLLEFNAVFGYLTSTIAYFVIRKIMNHYQNKTRR